MKTKKKDYLKNELEKIEFLKKESQNYTVYELAEKVGYDYRTIRKYLKENNLKSKLYILDGAKLHVLKLEPEKVEFLKKESQNYTKKELAERLGYKYRAIGIYLKNNNLKTKTNKVDGDKLHILRYEPEKVEFLKKESQNYTEFELAEKLGYNYKTIQRYLKRNNLKHKPDYKRKNHHILKNEPEKVEFLKKESQDYTKKELGERLGYHYCTIRDYLKANNLKAKTDKNDLTELEIEYLKQNSKDYCITALAQTLNRHFLFIKHKLIELNLPILMKKQILTEKEITFINENYYKLSLDELASQLKRSIRSIQYILDKIKIKIPTRREQDTQLFQFSDIENLEYRVCSFCKRTIPIHYLIYKNNSSDKYNIHSKVFYHDKENNRILFFHQTCKKKWIDAKKSNPNIQSYGYSLSILTDNYIIQQ